MFGSYLSAAVRHIGNNRFASVINIMSLAIGLAAALLVMLFVHHELSYDRWIPDAERVYRYETELIHPPGRSLHLAISPAAARDVLAARFSEIEAVTRFYLNIHSLHMADKVHYELVAFADENFFEVLDIPLMEGNKETALDGVSSVLLSEQMALKYFGEQSAMGQILSVEAANGGEIRDFRVTGVFRDIPLDSHLDLHFIASKQANDRDFSYVDGDSWQDFPVYTYLKLAVGARPELMEAQFPALLDTHVDATRWEGKTGSDLFRPYLIRLTDIHMDTRYTDPMRPLGDWGLVYALLGIALLILTIASINFMNLALARSFSRAREVSIRKVHGAGRRNLMVQYLGETGILTMISLGMALSAVSAALPHVNAFTGKDLALNSLMTTDMIIPLLVLLCFVAVVAGLYPAFVLASFRPAVIFRGTNASTGGNRLRTALVVFQFTVSIALGIGAAVIQSQRHFTSTHDLGFSTGDKMVIRYMNWGHFAEKSRAISERISALPAVSGTAYSGVVPGDGMNGFLQLNIPGGSNQEPVKGRPMNVDDGFFDVYGVELIAGRFFSREFGEDELEDVAGETEEIARFSTILNETAVHRLGFENAREVLGTVLDVGVEHFEPKVVGVVRDFHFSSLREEILPIAYYLNSAGFANLTVRFRPGTDVAGLVRDITAIWQEFIPRDPITLEYLDQNVAAHYENDRQRGVMVTGLAAIALFVACMGLYGLSALTALERSREVSIRKVHGASVPSVISLLLWQFSRPVFLAIILAWPLAWYAARQYLDQFSYRIELGPAIFIGAGLTAVLIAAATVGGHALKVARTNPICCLSER